ncbi:hypothetical protein FSP39_015105 [Pinctada imbricata]|uniref:RING-type E3 ubiquitin transferase n=1 Tax=Pinctada imbricata TaxID=66713 RepID=A0AA88Y2N5_PINIB|nr:hypothetical protein FSP39_015105 [Pinctada imbricata]
MSVGLRVVRGPDWNLGNKDQGEGHVGTVVKDNGNETFQVVWDMGEQTTCRGGKDGKSDLIILDNAPAGVKHLSVACEECGKGTIIGIRWQCNSCNDVSLCTPCYMTDKHEVSHTFKRIDKPHASSVNVPKRAGSKKIKAAGIFPGATVMRGTDWEYSTQDGGNGQKGKVEDVRNFGSVAGGRNAVRVRWDKTGEANVYRVGCKGKVDLKCVSEGSGTYYYKDHLPVLGKSGSSGSPNASPRSPVGRGAGGDTLLQIGDKCVVDMPEEALKECIGEVGTIKGFVGDSAIEVQYDDRSYQFYAGAVSKVYPIRVGDVVRVGKDEKKAILLQKNHGGWNADMKQALGLVGKVVKIDSDGDVAVAFGNNAWVFNPALLTPAPGETPNQLSGEVDFSKSTSEDPREELGDNLGRLMAHLLLLGALERQTIGPEQMVVAAAKGDLEAVQMCIRRNKDLVNCTFKDITPLIIACHEGNENIVKVLLQNGANINGTNEKGTTALLAALSGKEESIAILLVKNKANVNVSDANNRTPAHAAAYTGLCSALKVVLEAGGNPNRQDDDGDTPLHDAIEKRNDRAAAIILSHPRLDLTITNKKGFTPLILAAFKGHDFAAERIVGKAPDLVNFQNKDNHCALHVAAVNNHQEIASMLVLKGKAKLDLRNNNGMTACHLAAYEGHADLVKILVENGANFEIKDGDGDTVFHCAMRIKQNEGGLFLQLVGLTINNRQLENEKFKIVIMLLDKGANYNAKNNRGATPLQVCPSERLKNAVVEAIKKRQRTPQQQAASNMAEAMNELFQELLSLPCAVCKENVANVRFLPCKHKITCRACCFRVNRCPMCRQPIAERIDPQGRRLVPEPCQVQ